MIAHAACAIIELDDGWMVAQAPATPADVEEVPEMPGELGWLPARVPGTAAVALREAGLWRPGDGHDFDATDWWFATRFPASAAVEDERVLLALDGIATRSTVYLNATRILDSTSMYTAHRVDVGELLRADNELVIHCRALAPLLAVRRRPRARWRTRIVERPALRFHRTMLLGRMPGCAPEPACVGPWRPVRLERHRRLLCGSPRLRTRIDGEDGVATVRAEVQELTGPARVSSAALELSRAGRRARAELAVQPGSPGTVVISGEARVERVLRWWPHTHGEPALYDARLVLHSVDGSETTVHIGRIGFRDLRAGDGERDGVAIEINGVPVFARGAVWTPPDLASPGAPGALLEQTIDLAVEAGVNMLRIPGTGCYESERFHDLCDARGILVWQDFMFANLDYPELDPEFLELVGREAEDEMARLAGRPSLAVVCGGSEVAQQVAMLGLDPSLADGPLYREVLPAAVAGSGAEVHYVPSSPCGGGLPFRPGQGVAHYFGVGAYLRDLSDVRRAEVRFAAECLAFSNVPDPETVEAIVTPAGAVAHDPRWTAGIPRDAGAGWDFEDVRRHYLRVRRGEAVDRLAGSDPHRYLDLSRTLTGELMAEVMGEWRREGSPCRGALVLWLRDVLPGAGWGLIDHRGRPKVALHHLRRVWAPVTVWLIDEGLGGLRVHVANDRPEPISARLRVALYRDGALRVAEAEQPCELERHAGSEHDVEAILGRFVDASWAYRFGPPGHDLAVATLEGDAGVLAQAFHHPLGPPSGIEPADQLGLTGEITEVDGRPLIRVSTRRFAYGVRVHVPGHVAVDDAFSIEPGGTRTVELLPEPGAAAPRSGRLTALNLSRALTVGRGR